MTDEDRRLLGWCRMGLLAGAVLHWVAAILLLWGRVSAHASHLSVRPELAALMRLIFPFG